MSARGNLINSPRQYTVRIDCTFDAKVIMDDEELQRLEETWRRNSSMAVGLCVFGCVEEVDGEILLS